MTGWLRRVIVGSGLGATELPPWAERSYQILHEQVTDDAYPCFFGVQAERRGEMFYTFVERGQERLLCESMTKFAALASLPAYEKNNMAVFFEPDAVPLSHEHYHDIFWRILQMLHDADTHPHADQQPDPAESKWEFCYQGVEMFVVCACPSYRKRHSRNLGPGMVLLFQPRSVFIDKITNKVIGKAARETVRKRIRKWDAIGPHPDLGFYGEPGNLEWKQYFLPDDNRPNVGACPFLSRSSRAEQPLSPAQAALWFLSQMEPDGGAYHNSLALEIDGGLDVEKLRSALNRVAARYEVLRMRFVETEGGPRRRVDGAANPIDWSFADLRGEKGSRAAAFERLRARGNFTFDLSRSAQLRVTLLQLSNTQWILQLCAHCIVADAWSLDILQREIFECYDAGSAASGCPAQAEVPRVAPASSVQSDLAYWHGRLGDVPHRIELPFDYQRAACRSSASGRLSYALPEASCVGIRRLAEEGSTTSFAVSLSLFALLLQRYSGQNDLRVAVPLRRVAKDGPVGQHMNTVVVRLEVSSNDTFLALVRQTARYLSEAHEHGDLPFSRLVQSLRVPRSLADTPLCQVMCNELPTIGAKRYGDLRVQAIDDGVGRGQYDLSLNVAIGEESGVLALDYSTALFLPSTAQRLLTHYVELLEQLAGSPELSNSAMAVLRLSHHAAVPRAA